MTPEIIEYKPNKSSSDHAAYIYGIFKLPEPKSFNKPKCAKIYSGYVLDQDGSIETDHFVPRELFRLMSAPVLFYGRPGTLHFDNHPDFDINVTASRLIQHPGFMIRGDAAVTLEENLWHQIRVVGSMDLVDSKLDHLGFKDEVITRWSGWHCTHTNIYARDPDDLFAVRMAL